MLARAVLNDDLAQSRAARKQLKEALLTAVPLPSLRELVWVLRQGAKLPKDDVAAAVRCLMNAGNVVVNRPAAELGLAVLEAGGDFADGAIVYEGAWLGGEIFVSFDKHAITLVSGQGVAARRLSRRGRLLFHCHDQDQVAAGNVLIRHRHLTLHRRRNMILGGYEFRQSFRPNVDQRRGQNWNPIRVSTESVSFLKINE
ncbi:MAG TPA: type II toxin-antitoxin system VapC family toxin, partial [Acetobacteraceae bacterium]|nr:type II toxin-antitoxin system VapC family toxin [Acetobacteraceae bacterium]